VEALACRQAKYVPGYNAADLFNPFGENSLCGLLMRSLAEPLFPDWLEMFSLAAEIRFDQLAPKVEKWTDGEDEREVRSTKPEPPPIERLNRPRLSAGNLPG
jgi:hypothetical protein